MKTIVLSGRGYPTAEKAEQVMRSALERDGVTPVSVSSRRWTDRGLCPWEATAEVSDEDWERLSGGVEKAT